MYELPTFIVLNGQEWNIRNKADFRVILDCFLVLNDFELSPTERVMASLIIFLEDLNGLEDIGNLPDIEDAYNEMVKFFNCGQEEQKSPKSYKLVDWELDSTLIISAINKVAGKEIRSEYVHWWTFMGYYVAIGQCPLSTVVGIRYKKAHNEKLEKWERKFVQDNPQYFGNAMKTAEQLEAEDWVRKQWEGGST